MGLFSFYNKHKLADQNDGNVAVGAARRTSAGSIAGVAQESGLPEKKRARRRLVGAIVLALAAAVGLPMILDSEPKPLVDDISIEIPSKELDAGSATSASLASSPSSVASASAAASMAAAVVPQVKPVAEPAADPSLSPSEQIVEVAPTPARTARLDTSKPIQPILPTPSKPVEAAPKRAAPEPDKIQAAVHEELNQNKHNDAQHDAGRHLDAKAPFDDSNASKTPAKVHPKTPVEVKPVPLDADASRAMDILEGKPALKAHSGKKFVLQVAALASQGKIDELQNKLKAAGLHSYTEKVTSSNGDRTRIRLGPFASKEEADQVRTRLKEIGLDVPVLAAP